MSPKQTYRNYSSTVLFVIDNHYDLTLQIILVSHVFVYRSCNQIYFVDKGIAIYLNI